MSAPCIQEQFERIDLQLLKKKKVNLAVFGHGNVGGALLDQIAESADSISRRKDIILNVFALTNSGKAIINSEGIRKDWRKQLSEEGIEWTIRYLIDYAQSNGLTNLIAVDNTGSDSFVDHYPELVKAGFNLVSSNKYSNTRDLKFYKELRSLLDIHGREYLYETNVGAGLPLIDTIKLLHHSGENITRIRGVFSGSLSYIFNTFSEKEESFSTVVKRAVRLGLTELDPREDLAGTDVGRKLLILARELDLQHELSIVKIENLIPKQLRSISKGEFLARLDELDVAYHIKRKNQKPGHVLRYIGDLYGDLSHVKGGFLDVKLVSVSRDSMIGQLENSDSLFEIYTENYAQHPIVIKGAGAGGRVTALGVLGDILRLSDKLK
jgi:aspartokinase/homoserine dehydrogenase 1